MFIHISAEPRGRVDVVPDCGHVATEFVCAWRVPILPRRSFFYYKAETGSKQWTVVPVPLSGRSVLTAYLRAVLWAGIVASTSALAELAVEAGPKATLATAPVLAVPALMLIALGQLSRASDRRREALARLDGLPPRVVARLLAERFDVEEPERAVTFGAPESRSGSAFGEHRAVTVATGGGAAGRVRRACAWFLDGVGIVFVYLVSLVLLFGFAEQDPRVKRIVFNAMGLLALSMPIGIAYVYNVILPLSPLRATLGKRLVGLAVVEADGRRLRPRTALLRELVKYPCLLAETWFPNLEIAGIHLHDPRFGGCLHDRVSRTRVVRLVRDSRPLGCAE